MKLRGVFVILVSVLFLFTLSNVSSEIIIHNFTLETEYTSDQNISGEINLTILNENLESLFESDFGEISLKDFFEKTNVYYNDNCSTLNCQESYEKSGSGSASLNINLGDEEEYFGFVLKGIKINVNDFNFNIKSNFLKSSEIPLELKFFERASWIFDKSSTDFSEAASYGCYVSGTETAEIDMTRFCEKISIERDVSSLMLGADISGFSSDLKMVVYRDTELTSCTLDSHKYCITDEGVEAGDYYVCLETEVNTNFTIQKESGGDSCGWAQPINEGFTIPSEFTKDFAIFVKTPKYAAASELDLTSQDLLDLEIVSDIESYLNIHYKNKDCTDDCVLPIKVSGVSQNLKILNISLNYTDDGERESENKTYKILKSPVKVNFSGIISLEDFDFSVQEEGEKDFTLSLADEELIDEEIEVFSSSEIQSITPKNPLAGVPTEFTANLDSDKNVISYTWDFGDDTTPIKTQEDSVVHTYDELGGYDLILTITETSKRNVSKRFSVIVGSPEDVVDLILSVKNQSIRNSIKDLDDFQDWYKTRIRSLAQLDFYEGELKRLKKKITNAVSDKEFLEIALELQDLNVPAEIIISESTEYPLSTQLQDIDLSPILSVAGGSIDATLTEKYKNAVIVWQTSNIDAVIKREKISVISYDENQETILNIYNMDIDSNSNLESYFTIGKKREELFFEQDLQVRKSGDHSIIILNSDEEKIFNFYIEGDYDLVFYTSPKPSQLDIDLEIGTCNYNNRCEDSLGEDYKNCRNDCKPYGWFIFYTLLVIFIGLIIYTILQIWYKNKYENSLFKDRRQLFNLLMFIDNTKARGLKDEQIIKQLKQKKWSSEQIRYAMRKSQGKTTGMIEIIPIEKVSAFFRRKHAEEIQSQNKITQFPKPNQLPNLGSKKRF